MIIVSDTSPISDLILIGETDLLRKVFNQVVIPPIVQNEIMALSNLGYDLSEYSR